jgi:hypothetical protein
MDILKVHAWLSISNSIRIVSRDTLCCSRAIFSHFSLRDHDKFSLINVPTRRRSVVCGLEIGTELSTLSNEEVWGHFPRKYESLHGSAETIASRNKFRIPKHHLKP